LCFARLYLWNDYTSTIDTRVAGTGSQNPPYKWIYSQGVYIEPKRGGEVKIFGFDNKKQQKKMKKKRPKKKKN